MQGLSWYFNDGEGLVFLRDNRLCMGLNSSSYVFSKISDFVIRCIIREEFTEYVNYLDDFSVMSPKGNGIYPEKTKFLCWFQETINPMLGNKILGYRY